MTNPPTWFKSLVVFELIFQMPFFLLAIYAIMYRNSSGRIIRGDGIFRSLCMIYGSSTATTLIPIFASMAFAQSDATTFVERGTLVCFYLPYAIFPIWLVVIAACEEDVFGTVGMDRKRR